MAIEDLRPAPCLSSPSHFGTSLIFSNRLSLGSPRPRREQPEPGGGEGGMLESIRLRQLCRRPRLRTAGASLVMEESSRPSPTVFDGP